MKIYKNRLAMSLLMLLLIMPLLGLAQVTTEPPPGTDQPVTFERILGILNRLTNWLLIILVAIAIIFFLIAAYKYLTAAGNPEKIKEAHKMVAYAVVALVVGGLAKGVTALVLQLIQ